MASRLRMRCWSPGYWDRPDVPCATAKHLYLKERADSSSSWLPVSAGWSIMKSRKIVCMGGFSIHRAVCKDCLRLGGSENACGFFLTLENDRHGWFLC
jgi:hypothetical protein